MSASCGRWATKSSPSPDGKRFVFIQKGDQEKEAKHLNVVLNWFEELDRKVPVR